MFVKESQKRMMICKKRLKRFKIVKEIIKQKRCQKSTRIKKTLKNANFA